MSDATVESPRKQLLSVFQLVGAALSVIVGTERVLIDLLSPNEVWIRWYIIGIVPVIGLLCANILRFSLRGFLTSGHKMTNRRFAVAVLCFFSMLLALNLRLVYNAYSDSLLYDLLINLDVSLFGFFLFFLVPWMLRWRADQPEAWPINISSFVLGFVPWIIAFIIVAIVAGSELRIFYLIMLLGYGASFTHILGYSHPKNVAYDVFIAKVILVATIAIAVLAGLGGLALGVNFWLQDHENMAIITLAAVMWWSFILMLVAVEVAYRYQYQKRIEINNKQRSSSNV